MIIDDATILFNLFTFTEDESYAVYSDIFSDTSLEVGKTLSKRERDMKDLNEEKSLIYGEVDYSSFYRVLRKINPMAGGTFYDLGSGTGKGVIAARLVCDFSRCLGIEILEGLHTQGAKIMQRFNSNYQEILSAGQHQMAAVCQGSFLDYDWSDGDVVFANSTCYDEKLMLEMADMARNLRPGAFFVTFTKGLNIPDAFELIERKRYRMSWGPATVFIQRRLNHDGSSVGNFKLNLLPSDEESYSDEEDMDLLNASDPDDSTDDDGEDDDDDFSEDENDDDSDSDVDDDDSDEIDYEEYLRDRAKFYSDYVGDYDDDDEDDEDYLPTSSEEDSDSENLSEESGSSNDNDEMTEEEFYAAMKSLGLPTSTTSYGGADERSGSNKSTPNSSSRHSSNKSTPVSDKSPSGSATPPHSSPSQNQTTPPSYHSGNQNTSSGTGEKAGSLKVNVPSHLQQNFQESIGSPQDVALLRKKNRSRVAIRNKEIGAGY